MKTALCLFAFLIVSSMAIASHADVRSDAQAVTVDEVLAMMKAVPEKAHPSRPGRYDQVGDAQEIARGIAMVAPQKDTAALLAVFAAYESSNQKCVGGDKNAAGEFQSWGTFQLRGVSMDTACNPELAAAYWLKLKAQAEATCAENPIDDRLAPLTGGSCERGRAVSRTRHRIARTVAAAVP